ncbi:hypothetical protein QAD02_013229 [Eretmocerus hayati]|uniref:Uncharacterized protein n=1 Tax=Eretmocerus hayati TaxID=131215 RepID=A0ACC2P4T3_9HYME|nr:hypothetical protein QAD02_013229 [Eretmocerus hayati]
MNLATILSSFQIHGLMMVNEGEENDDFWTVRYRERSGDNTDDSAIRGFVENLLPDAPTGWPEYKCYPQATAKSYNGAILILESLKKADEIVSHKNPRAKRGKEKVVILADQLNAPDKATDMSTYEISLKSFPNMDVYVQDEREQFTQNNDHSLQQQGSHGSQSELQTSNDDQTLQQQDSSSSQNGRDDEDDSSDEEPLSNKEFKRFVVKKLKSLEKTTKTLKSDLSDVAVSVYDTETLTVEQRSSSDLVDVPMYDEFCSQIDFELPIKNMKLFDEFNAALVDLEEPELKELMTSRKKDI